LVVVISQASFGVEYLRSPLTIRERGAVLFELACQDRLDHFFCDLSLLDKVADFVIETIQATYPTLQIPIHSRWRHFEIAGHALLDRLQPAWGELAPKVRVRAALDLVIVSVLLDAGAGATWRYCDRNTQISLGRSEGLAIASFQAFQDGLFSRDPFREPWRVDAERLQTLSVAELADSFQVSDTNPLVGLEGRCALLQRLGQVLQAQPVYFGQGLDPLGAARPGNLVAYLEAQSIEGTLSAADLLKTLLASLGDIWPGRISLDGVNLGDVWRHPALERTVTDINTSDLMPFHKLSQWLTYSLLEPLQAYGLTICDQSVLTGLAEYRNGGLCLDLGLFKPKRPDLLQQAYTPDATVIVEWRALTIIALDRIAQCIRQKLGLSEAELPLPNVLQGGTWAAGRQIARQKRPDGSPPIQLVSDGTVF
jgi:Protein of unknown function (DUF1688)